MKAKSIMIDNDSYLYEIRNTDEEFYLKPWLGLEDNKRRRIKWTGKKCLPEGSCMTRYILIDLDTGEEISAVSESWIIRNEV